MGAIDERKALERLSQAWRRLITGGKPPSPPAVAPPASPSPETPPQSPQEAPGAPIGKE